MPFETQFSRDVALAFAVKKQTAYGTALADADISNLVELSSSEGQKITRGFRSNRDRVNRKEFGDVLRRIQSDTRYAMSYDLDTLTAALLCAFGLGKTTTSQPDMANDPNAWEHVLILSDPAVTKHVAVATFAEELSAGVKRILPDMAVADFIISGARGAGALGLAGNWIGSGKENAAHATFPANYTAVELLFNRDLDILLGTEGSPTSIKERIVDWSVSFSNNLQADEGYNIGSGEFRGQMFHGPRREVSVSLGILAKEGASDDIRAWFDGETKKELQITVEGPLTTAGAAIKHKLEIRLPALRVTALDDGEEGGNKVWRVECGPDGVMKGATLTEPIQITVINEEEFILA